MLAVVPFMLWLGPMADETPLPVIAVLLGLGQPIGLWLLYALIGQDPRLLEFSNLLVISFLRWHYSDCGGRTAVQHGAPRGAFDEFCSHVALGLSSSIYPAHSGRHIERGVGMILRALGLTLMAASVTIGRAVDNRWVNYVAVVIFILGALNLAGIAPGLRSYPLELVTGVGSDGCAPVLFIHACHSGCLDWHDAICGIMACRNHPPTGGEAEYTPPVFVSDTPLPLVAAGAAGSRSGLTRLGTSVVQRFPAPIRHGGGIVVYPTVARSRRELVLLLGLGLGSLFYNTTPNLWFTWALETTSNLPFLR